MRFLQIASAKVYAIIKTAMAVKHNSCIGPPRIFQDISKTLTITLNISTLSGAVSMHFAGSLPFDINFRRMRTPPFFFLLR